MMGQLIVYRVEQRIAADPKALRGVVDIYPMLNRSVWISLSAWFPPARGWI